MSDFGCISPVSIFNSYRENSQTVKKTKFLKMISFFVAEYFKPVVRLRQFRDEKNLDIIDPKVKRKKRVELLMREKEEYDQLKCHGVHAPGSQ